MAELTKGLAAVFEFLKGYDEGDLVTADQIMKATGWKPSSLRTYVQKNKLAGFRSKRADGRFEVLRNGSALTEADIAGALTQVTPDTTRFMPNEKVSGSLGEYKLEGERGRGATAHVWTAVTKKTGERVAVKIVNPRPDLLDASIFKDLQRRFRREAENGRTFKSEFVIRIIDLGVHRNLQFLVMELANRSVKEMLEASGAFDVEDASKVVGRCLVGLHHLHLVGCVHRDVKPANMLVTGRGVVLGDLGIVKWSDLNPEFVSAGTMTTAAINLGSLNYMAPEQRDAPKTVTSASDVYALGVSWYELLTNARPSPAAFAAGKAPAPTSDPKITKMISRMTSYEASDRPSVSEIAKFLRVDLPSA
jgi:serine/threonine-protein kinase